MTTGVLNEIENLIRENFRQALLHHSCWRPAQLSNHLCFARQQKEKPFTDNSEITNAGE
jgi:hypothetical protein